MKADFTSTSLQAASMVILAPAASAVPVRFRNARVDRSTHERLLSAMQKLRGSVYLADGAIRPSELCSDGRHILPIDDESWHVLTLNQEGRVSGCARYRQYDSNVSFHDLSVGHSALARSQTWGNRLTRAIEAELRRARAEGLAYVEAGGWALAKERRCSTDALRIALAAYGLGQALGGCLGLVTATVRNHSSSILRRLGGRSFEVDGVEFSEYYDPQYSCRMELLRFRSDTYNPTYARRLQEVGSELMSAPVICAAPALSVPFSSTQRPSVRQVAAAA